MDGLIVKKVSKSFGQVKALNKANFSVEFGEVHALLGENGAGKSTLIKILSGFQSADEGEIFLGGKPLKLKDPHDAIRHRIGTVYQELSLIPDFTVAENLFFENWPAGKMQRIERKKLRAKAKKVLKKYDLEEINPDMITKNLTLSQQQMIEIVKTLLRDPQIVILDEATSALTDNKVQWLLKLAKDFARAGKIVIFISHRMKEVLDSCDRITIFRNGQDVGVRKATQENEDEFISLMLGRKLSAFFPDKISYCRDEVMLAVKDCSIDRSLDKVSFDLRKGEVLGVGGLAGQGQVPLFLGLAGIYRCEGTLRLDGKNITVGSPEEGIRQGIVIIPENRATEGLIQTLSIRENLSLPVLSKISKFGVIKARTENENISRVISKLSIKTADANETLSNLSGGNQQKVLIGKYLLNHPKVYLMLDPTRGVDVGTKMEIFNLVRNIAEQGYSVLYYSTDIDELVHVCDRVMVMYDKKIADILQEDEITKENILKVSVGGKSHG